MDRVLLHAPFFSTIALGPMALLETGCDEQRQHLLPRIVRVETKVCVALIEAYGRYDPRGIPMRASIRGNRATLTRTKLFVVDAEVSDYIICVARTRGARSRFWYQSVCARQNVPWHRLYSYNKCGPNPSALRDVVHTCRRLSRCHAGRARCGLAHAATGPG
jgi:hypothetical protein